MFTHNGNPISIDNEFTTEDGVTYPHLRDPAIREELGIIEVPDPEQYDQRFYWGVDNPKDLDQLKVQWVGQSKADANAQLAQTDWMVIRKAERDVAIPDEVIAERQAVIDACAAKEAAITASTTVEELIVALGYAPTEAAPAQEEPAIVVEEVPAATSEQVSAL